MYLYFLDICKMNFERDLDIYCNLLDKHRILKYNSNNERKRRLGSVIIQKVFAKMLLNTDFKLTILDYSQGKPYIKEDITIQYNISHCGNMVVGVLHDKPIGIDIIDKSIYINMLDEKFWHPKEQEQINTGAINKHILWTQIEAYTKCRGTGITDLDNREFYILNNMVYNDGIIDAKYSIYGCNIDKYYISICVAK